MKTIIKDYTDLPENLINEKLKNYKPTELKGDIWNKEKNWLNEYDVQHLDINNELSDSVKNMVQQYFPDYKLVNIINRLNKIVVDSNKNDGYHDDNSTGNIIVIHYPKLNTPFEGGEFDWKDTEIIKPTPGLNLILVNNPPHRVLNVTKGERYSFSFFFKMFKRNNFI
jgi:hypothetical protein